ncbi:MAG: phenylacetate--CoA ligase family protein [Candidatus Binatia bacterium]
MADYEQVRQRHVLRMFELMPGLVERLDWSAAQLRAERDARLRELVAHARARSPWHRRRLAAVDVDRLDAGDLGALPVMTKDDLMDHFDEIVTDPRLTRDVVEAHLDGLTSDAYLLDELHACASGGSSGRRGVFVYGCDAWVTVFVSYLRFSARMTQAVMGAEMPRMCMVAAGKAAHMTAAVGQTFAPPGDVMRRLPATWPLERIVAELNALQPEVLQGYATMIHQLAHEALAGRLRIAPRLVGTTSEPLLPEIRAAITAAWAVPVFNGFGSTEGLMGGSCRAGRGIHLSDDLFVIEPVDARGRPIRPGERAARVYLTNLYNLTQPLIRYELTDEMSVLDGPCPCGMALLRIDDIEGRHDDAFVYPGGPTVHPLTFRAVLGQERAIIEYQVRQTPRGADVQLRAERALDTARLGAALRAALAAAGLADATVSVAVVEGLARQASGKLRRFVPLTAAAAVSAGDGAR